MENISFFVQLGFVGIVILTAFFFYKASHHSKTFLWVVLGWVLFQIGMGFTGIYTITTILPPPFILVIMPPLVLTFFLFFTKKGQLWIDQLDVSWLTISHVVRIPVELVLFYLFLQKTIPLSMTFEGLNFDIFSGITAPLVYYFGYKKGKMPRKLLIVWNITCLILLFIIVGIALLSAPLPFQQLSFDQPNVAVLHLPFLFLPGLIVPLVLFSHLVSLRKLLKSS